MVFIVVPGIYNSGPTHWQTRWEAADTSMVRFAAPSWDEPRMDGWVAALDDAVAAAGDDSVLIAHSLACLLVPWWASSSALTVAGAFMVAPVDPAAAAFPEAARDFEGFARVPLPFPGLVVASLNDPYATAGWAGRFAADLGADFVVAGALGHINADSDLGAWPQGLGLLRSFVAGLS